MIEIIKKGSPQHKANLHSHSTLSDGKMMPAELKKLYKERGYSVLAITDHEYPCDHSALSENDFLMLTGYEASISSGEASAFSPLIHINLFAKDPHNTTYIGAAEPYSNWYKDAVKEKLRKVGPEGKREYTPAYINEFIRTAKENGYICAHNHPYWSMEAWDAVAQYEGFFSMEIFNLGSSILNGLEYNGQLYEHLLRKGKRLFCHSADDNHNIAPLDHPKSDSFGGFTMILAEELTYPAVFEALEKGKFYSSMGPKIHALYIDGDHVHIETDPVKQIVMHNGGRKTQFLMGDREKPVTSADFTIAEGSPFVRLTATDFEGRSADTRGIFMDEIR